MVAEDDVIVEVMTEKAAVEVPSPVSGTCVSTPARPGIMVPVGAELIVFETQAASASEAAQRDRNARPRGAAQPRRVAGNRMLAAQTNAPAATHPAAAAHAATIGAGRVHLRASGAGGNGASRVAASAARADTCCDFSGDPAAGTRGGCGSAGADRLRSQRPHSARGSRGVRQRAEARQPRLLARGRSACPRTTPARENATEEIKVIGICGASSRSA